MKTQVRGEMLGTEMLKQATNLGLHYEEFRDLYISHSICKAVEVGHKSNAWRLCSGFEGNIEMDLRNADCRDGWN
jgi:hypothetical protein